MIIREDIFGVFYDEEKGEYLSVKRYTLRTESGIKIQIINYGASISDVILPDKHGKEDHVVLGFNNFPDYCVHYFMGSTVGRVANRIEAGKFNIGNKTFQLNKNEKDNHLHGGNKGWDKYLWESWIEGNKVLFYHKSPDGNEGYPSTVETEVRYSLDEDGSLSIEIKSFTDGETPINITNHSYFNLAGHASGQSGLFEHDVQLFADYYLPVNEKLIPTGAVQKVDDTPFDLRDEKCFEEAIKQSPDQGFDHCFCVRNNNRGELALSVRATHPPSGRYLEVYTTEPGIQIYTGNFLPTKDKEMVGYNGFSYYRQGAFCCEPQNYPNAINEVSFPNSILRRGDYYKHQIVYKFGTLYD